MSQQAKRSMPISIRTALVAGFCFLLAGPAGVAYSGEVNSAPRPNIVFILADDLGYGDIGCYGQKNFATPNLDRMADQGVRFTQHYSGSCVCAPSRACLLTGQHTGHVFQRANGNYQFREDPLDVCIARRLKDVGYHTAMIGKSGLSCNSDDGSLPNRKGFDHFFGFTSHAAAHRYYPPELWRNGDRIKYAGNRQREGNRYSGDLFLTETLEYLSDRAHDEAPFFLQVSFQQPHADLNVPAKWRDPFIGQFDEHAFRGDHYRAEKYPKSTFAGMVTFLDDAVGQILSKIDDLGLAEETLVLFSSDNGAMSEGGWSRRYFSSSGPLRGGKRDLYEGGIRVPLIASWKGVITPASESDHICAFWDFVPTACELAGAPIPADSDGISYLPSLSGKGPQREHEFLYWEFYEEGGKQAVRWGDWKAVRLNVNLDLDAPIKLYDLSSDIGERTDLSRQNGEVVEQMKVFMDRAHQTGEIVRFTGESAAAGSGADSSR